MLETSLDRARRRPSPGDDGRRGRGSSSDRDDAALTGAGRGGRGTGASGCGFRRGTCGAGCGTRPGCGCEAPRLREGRAAVLMIGGEAGIGKTRLVEGHSLTTRGPVAWRCSADALIPSSATARSAWSLLRWVWSARSPDPRSAGTARCWPARALISASFGACRRRPVPRRRGHRRARGDSVRRAPGNCWSFEDIHWADTASLLTIPVDRATATARSAALPW